jgi:hypothetical protein
MFKKMLVTLGAVLFFTGFAACSADASPTRAVRNSHHTAAVKAYSAVESHQPYCWWVRQGIRSCSSV